MNNTKSVVDLSAKLTKYQQRAAHGDAKKRELYNRKVAQYSAELGKLGAQLGGNLTKTLVSQQQELENALAELKQSIGVSNDMTTDPTSTLIKLSNSSNNNFTNIDDILNNSIMEAAKIGSR